jgi:anti-sigma B factor antagonist
MPTPPSAASGKQLECQTEATAEAIILHLAGEVDLLTAPLVSSTLKTLAQNGHSVIVDLSRLQYMDSSGFKAILDATPLFLERALRFLLSEPPDGIRKVMDILEFDKIVPVFPSADAAKESIRAFIARQGGQSGNGSQG